MDNDDLTFVIYEVAEDSWGKAFQCFAENKTGKNLVLTWDDASINGYMVEPYWAVQLPAGTKAYTDVSFMKEDLEKNEITDIQEVEFTLRAYDGEDWFNGDVLKETYMWKR